MSPRLEILHTDERIVVVAKPVGSVVVPGRGPDPEEPLSHALGRELGSQVWVVHRLDREASGVVLFARDAEAHRSLSLQFERRETSKSYLVLVQGAVAAPGEVDRPLREFGSGRVAVDPRGKPALTRWRVLRRFPGATLLEVEPVTGRRHQIRVHLYSIGHPVMGDTRYGEPRPVGGAPRLMLHAHTLAFVHPDGAPTTVRSEPGPDFEAVLRLLPGSARE